MTISEAMAEEYGRRYGLRFEDFMNCASVPAECPPLCDVPPGSPLKLVYVGGLHLNRWQAIRRIGEALDQLAEEGIPAELEIHAPETDFKLYAPQFEGIRTIRSGGSLTQEQIPAALRDADVLVHVESFDDASRRYTRLSISTKIPQYLAAGRPIFGYGPMEVASCGYLQSSACGVVVGVPDPQKILETLRTLLENSTMRRNCGRRAWEQACRRHDEKAVRERFRALLAEAAQPSKRTTR
jgi:glycosyltransferase involved in cell wall biosynthesis